MPRRRRAKSPISTTFIRWHIEKKYNIDFDQGLDANQKAIAWAFEKMAEDQLYWVVVHDRWMNDDNFRKGPVRFFHRVPAPIRPFVIATVRRKVRTALHGHGFGRHSPDEIVALGTRSIDAIADFLGDKPFFMSSEPTGADAAIFSFACAVLCPHFESRTRRAAERHENVPRYVGRMTGAILSESGGTGRLQGCGVAQRFQSSPLGNIACTF